MNTDDKQAFARPVQRRLLIPLAAVLLFLIGGITFGLIFWQQNTLNQSTRHLGTIISESLPYRLAGQARFLKSIGMILSNDSNIRDALKDQDRERLLAHCEPLLIKLKKAAFITHFYFHRPDRVNLLRVHKTDFYGDTINRFTACEAERTGGTASGIELGPLGLFTLRSVQPIFDGDTLIGYLELGKEIEDILENIQKKHSVELAVTIHKSALNREKWESGMHMLGREGDWDQFSTVVMPYSSLGEFPPECEYFVNKVRHIHHDVMEEVTFGGRSWRIMSHPLIDAFDAEVGDLIIIHDISEAKDIFHRFVVTGLCLALILLCSLFSFFLVILRKTDRGILKQQKTLIESEERFRILTDQAADAVFVHDFKGHILTVNQQACECLGYSRTELTNMSVLEIDSNLQSLPEAKKMWNDLTVGQPITLDGIHRRKDGTTFPVELRIGLIELMGSHTILALARDITKRKNMEEELRQAQKMEAIGTLAGGIAHDFNNILSAIFGYTELAKMEINNPDKLSKDIEGVHKGAIRARDLVKQILTFCRKTEEERQPLQMSLIVKEALKLVRSTIPTSIAIKQSIESQGTVLADPTQIHQVMMNLCTNAYHAMRETGGTLGVSLKEMVITEEDYIPEFELAPGKYLQLEVSDTGCGMGKETVEKIFDPYFTTKEKGEGTGLGLAVVHGIVKGYGGHINVYSESGEGTIFHVYLPEVQEEAGEYSIVTEKEPLKGGNERIMVVDDEKMIIDIAQNALTTCGYTVTTFPDGVQALQEFKKHPDHYDLVITDMAMPYMNGTELAQKLMEIRPIIPIILSTGYSEMINKEKAEAMGIKEFVQKPVVLSNLLRATRKVLDMQNQAEE